MELEFIKNKVYYKIFDRDFKESDGIYVKHKNYDGTKLATITKNIDNICKKYSAKKLLILKQVHGNKVICGNYSTTEEPEADASVTTEKNLALSILTADCVPVLFASDCGKIIGAAHCGWKSAKSGIIANVKKQMEEKGATSMKAIIGPSIQQKSYEVDENYYNNFINDKEEYNQFFINAKTKGRYMFDLPAYVCQKLYESEIELIHHIKEDTYTNKEKYPSYRRNCHEGNINQERILSTIIIRD